jgi:hypothetical protein
MRSGGGLDAALISAALPTVHHSMLDLLYIALIVVLLALSLAMIRLFDRV